MIRFPTLLTALALLFALPAAGQTMEERLDAVKEFKRFFRRFNEEAQQVEAVMTLKGNECEPAAEELLDLLNHRSGAVRAAALDVLATYQSPETWDKWLAELPSLGSDDKALVAKVLGRAKLKAAVPVLVQIAEDEKTDATTKYQVLRALIAIGDRDVAGAVGPLLSDPEPLVRIAAVDAVGALKLFDLGKQAVPLLTDEAWQVRTAAITAVGQVRPTEAVQPLIDLMREKGRLREECAEALFLITGFDFGVDPDRWQAQWDQLMDIPGWRIPTEEELAKKAESRKRYDAFYGNKTESNTFAGIRTTSTRVLFIIDISGSMDDLVVEREKFASGYEDFKKLTIVKTELIRTIETLTADTWFDIVAFATDLDTWKGRLVSANIVNRRSAVSWVERLEALGGTESQELAAAGLSGSANLAAGKTNTFKALMYPFGVDPDKPVRAAITPGGRVSIKNKLDTVYFLSDGRPSVGKLVDTEEIRKEVTKYNEVFKIVIHSIAIGEFQKNFLMRLAQDNGGVFVDLGR